MKILLFFAICFMVYNVSSKITETTTDRKDPNEGRNIICWLTSNNFTAVCKELVEVFLLHDVNVTLNSDISTYNEQCQEYDYLNPRHEEFGNKTWARRCPTEPPFYVADAHVLYFVFVFKRVEGGLNRTHIIGGLKSLGYDPDAQGDNTTPVSSAIPYR